MTVEFTLDDVRQILIWHPRVAYSDGDRYRCDLTLTNASNVEVLDTRNQLEFVEFWHSLVVKPGADRFVQSYDPDGDSTLWELRDQASSLSNDKRKMPQNLREIVSRKS